jgi:hypothetical protein
MPADSVLLPFFRGYVHVEVADDPDVAAGFLVVPDPTEGRRDDVGDLPGVRQQRLAGPLALDVSQRREGSEHLVDTFEVERRATHVARLRRLDGRRAVRQRVAARLHVGGDLGAELEVFDGVELLDRSPCTRVARP